MIHTLDADLNVFKALIVYLTKLVFEESVKIHVLACVLIMLNVQSLNIYQCAVVQQVQQAMLSYHVLQLMVCIDTKNHLLYTNNLKLIFINDKNYSELQYQKL